MTVDLGEMYRRARQCVCAMVSADNANMPVPATPDWNVHDVVAHLAGVAVDVTTGNVHGAGTDPWTAAQVARSVDTPVQDLVDIWSEHAPTLEGLLSSPKGAAAAAAAFDAVTHQLDLSAALGLQPDVDVEHVGAIARYFRTDFADAVAAAGLAPVAVDVTDLELIRSRLGRRTRAEAAALAWSADPEPYLDVWFRFGPALSSLGESRG